MVSPKTSHDVHKDKFQAEGLIFNEDLLIAGYKLYCKRTGWITTEAVLQSLKKRPFGMLPDKIAYYGEKPKSGTIYLISAIGKFYKKPYGSSHLITICISEVIWNFHNSR